MTDWAQILGWASPIGLGTLFVLLALGVYLFSRASVVNRKDRGDKN